MAQQTVSKMERVQTAVEWLVEQLLIYGDKALNKEISLGQYHIKKQELIEQAKQMEKQQIKMAWRYGDGKFDKTAFKLSEEYYKETYEK